VGTGSATSLTLTGPTGTTTGGAISLANGSTLTLTGNTIASITNNIISRGGTLVLDNSAGNPTSGQRITSAGGVTLAGGGSTIEFRGASVGTTFNGLTGALGAAGSGDTYLRTVQNVTGALAVSFASISRGNTSGLHYFENIGAGFVGDAGKPTVTFTMAPTTRQGVISTSSTTTIPYAIVSSRSTATSNDVTGRWANYNSGVVASTTTAFTGTNFGGATAGTNVLYNANAAGTVNHSGTNQLASVVFEPSVSGVTYNIGSGNEINTLGILVSGTQDMTISGGSLFTTSGNSTRSLLVLNPTTTLFTDSNILTAGNGPTTTGGQGFVVLNGTANQVASTTSANLNLGGGTLRVNSTNLDLTTTTAPIVRFRGGVLEYDVTSANFTFNRALGTAAGQVNFTSNAGDSSSTNTGSGGFSAFSSTTVGNALTVNIGGAAATLNWNDTTQLFVSTGYALKFGSTKSNATVVFQNGLGLDGTGTFSSGYQAREVNVTRGIGTVDDRTRLTGVISGGDSTDFVKTGNGTLELVASANLYSGNTLVQGGTLLATGGTSATGTGNVFVSNTGTLAGEGTIAPSIGNSVNVVNGGTIRAGSLDGAGKLIVSGNVNIGSGGTLSTKITSGTANLIEITGANAFTFDPNAKVLIDGNNFAFSPATTYTYTIATSGTSTAGLSVTNQSLFSFTNFANSGDYTYSLSGNAAGAVILTFTPVPEPGTMVALGAAGLGLLGAIRRYHLRKGAVDLAA